MKKDSFLPRLALLTTSIIWGTSSLVMKNALGGMPVLFLLGTRFALACLVLAVLFYKKLRLINRDYLKCGALMGTLMIAAYSVQTYGLTTTTPGKNIFLTAMYCVFVPFLNWPLAHRRPSRFNLLASALCIGGMGLVALDGLSISRGDALSALSGLLYAAHIVCVTRCTNGRDPILLTLLQFAVAGAWGLAGSLLFETPPALHPAMLGQMAYLVLMATALALLLQTWGQKHTPPAPAAILLSLEAVFTIAFSVLLGYEGITLRLAAGFALIFGAVLVSEAPTLRRRR